MTNSIVSLEIATQLKVAGWKKETYFAYADGEGELMPLDYHVCNIEVYGYYAPMLHEILEELPSYTIEQEGINSMPIITSYDSKFETYCEDGNLANSLAKYWLWAVKEGYITLNK